MAGTLSVFPIAGYEEKYHNIHNATFLFHPSRWTSVGGGKME